MADVEEEAVVGEEEGLEEEEALGEEEQHGEEEEKEEEEEEKDPDMPLNEEVIAESLSLLCKTGDGLAHAYVRLDVHERDISCLNSLTHLLTLKADNNKLISAKLDELPYLQVASFSNNRIKTTEGINHPLLEQLCLNFNELTLVDGLDPNKLSRLHTLELRGNKLTSTAGICLPNLKNLFMAANQITKLEGLDQLEHLATLHLRDNQLENLDGFSENMKNLQYINLRGNNITDMKQIKKLMVLPLLRAVALSDNPIADEDDYRMEVLIALRRIERLDKDEYTDEERQEAQDTYETRRQEELAAAAVEQPEEVAGSENEVVVEDES
ncbi:hypothetical protein LSH36_30g00029 [Paralvinella palmiformis]|uniref:Leucine-rich repeat-containing protein 23 n=1 Tax=Paralvinella palmiformis TaxID=53620 RepID=A0AAD9NEG3_9ANNE|nr:hypothetical protein LSH36_30g00029 [Paralvinella palmiformis]